VLSTAAIERLAGYSWPGNVRELQNAAERLVVSWDGRGDHLERLVQHMTTPVVPAALPAVVDEAVEESLFARMVSAKESFWSAVGEPFIARDLARDEVVDVVRRGLRQACGNYRQLAVLFNLDAPGEDRRLVGFLKKHRCYVSERALRATA
jgi:DNA-binding NtrC family response regulator